MTNMPFISHTQFYNIMVAAGEQSTKSAVINQQL